uniref:Uncharacterized protein n=1 Tax=Oryza glumipatula TaxID=40148 RepID=A0A0E0AVA2_9ORYZ
MLLPDLVEVHKVDGDRDAAVHPLHDEPLHQHRPAAGHLAGGVLVLVDPPSPARAQTHPLPAAARRPEPHVPVVAVAPAALLPPLDAPADEHPLAVQLPRVAVAVPVRRRLPPLLERHLVERGAVHLLRRGDAALLDEEERGVPLPDGGGRRRRERVEGELARPERGVQPRRLAEVEVLGLGGVHAPVLLAVEEVGEAVGGDGPRREPAAPPLHDLDLLVDVGRVEHPRLGVVDAAAEAERGHVLLAGARPDEALVLAGGDDGYRFDASGRSGTGTNTTASAWVVLLSPCCSVYRTVSTRFCGNGRSRTRDPPHVPQQHVSSSPPPPSSSGPFTTT